VVEDTKPYKTKAHLAFRAAVLDNDPICVLCRQAAATVADHYPRSRRVLVLEGLDPNDPKHGRGLCSGCHNAETARLQPGGWAAG
jgi:5-methylcytosine-specific restriction protein A